MTRLRRDRVSLGRRGRVVYWGYWTCRVGGTSPRRCVGVYSSGSLRRYSAARGPRTGTPRLGARGQILRARGQRADTPLSLIGESLSSVRSSAIPKLGPLLRTLTRYSECGQPRPRAEQAAHVPDALVSRVANPQRIIGQQRQPNPTTRAHHHTDPCYTHPREQPIAQMRRLPTQGINNIFLALNGVRH